MNRNPAQLIERESLTVSQLQDPVFLQELRAQMLSFARLQLRDEALAEDAVQEALAGALKNASSFGRRSALKTWVLAILKNKIADLLRKNQHVPDRGDAGQGHDEATDGHLFDARGFWKVEERPADWPQPMEFLRSEQFWRVFEACLDDLPQAQARVFMMREFVELDSAEICESLGISTSNLHVMLYRARLRLRECLGLRWLNEGEKP